MDNYPLLNLFFTMLYFFLWIAWIMLVFRIIGDIFRSDDLGGVAKAGWMLLILVIPWLGALIYLIARGTSMYSRDAKQAEASRDAVAQWIAQSPSAAAGSSPADQLVKLAELHRAGDLTDAEWEQQKAKVLA